MAITSSVQPRRLTVAELDLARSAGVFGPEEQLELINGQVYSSSRPLEPVESTAIKQIAEALREAFQERAHVRIQQPLEIDKYNRILPDVAVVLGEPREYMDRHPTTALLVVELSDATVKGDRSSKFMLYADAGVTEFWILNPTLRKLKVHRKPRERSWLCYEWTECKVYDENDAVSPLHAPAAEIRVADLLP